MYAKPSAQGVPLSSESWHQPSIHVSWPISRVLHCKNCCNSLSGFRSATLALFNKIGSSCPAHPVLADLAESIATGSTRPGNGKSVAEKKCSRIVLPYHPCLRRLNARLATVHASFCVHGWHELVPKVSWCVGGQSVSRLVLADGKKKLSYAGDPGGD